MLVIIITNPTQCFILAHVLLRLVEIQAVLAVQIKMHGINHTTTSQSIQQNIIPYYSTKYNHTQCRCIAYSNEPTMVEIQHKRPVVRQLWDPL